MRERTDYESLQNPESAVRFRDGKEEGRFSALIHPGMKMPSGATSVNGITDAMLDGKPPLEEVLPGFLEFAGDGILIAHNASFDLGFVAAALRKQARGVLPNDYVDTRPMSQRAWPGRSNYKLQSLAVDLGIKSLEAHRAEDDARVCMEVFLAGLKKLNPGGQTSFF